MEDSIVSFETTKLAKAEGFIGHAYDIHLGKIYYDLRNGSIGNWDSFYSFDYMLDVTTQSLLQKWLRDEHDIHIHVEIKNVGVFIGSVKGLNIMNEYKPIAKSLGYHDKYETAMEKCLLKAVEYVANKRKKKK